MVGDGSCINASYERDGGNASDVGDDSGCNARDGEWQMKLLFLSLSAPPAVRPGS